MKIECNHLRSILSDLLEDHAPGKLGGMFCVCELCEKVRPIMSELDANLDRFLILEEVKS